MLRQSVVKSKIAEFVNSPTDEGFTALHFAAFRGNVVRYQNIKHGYANTDEL